MHAGRPAPVARAAPLPPFPFPSIYRVAWHAGAKAGSKTYLPVQAGWRRRLWIAFGIAVLRARDLSGQSTHTHTHTCCARKVWGGARRAEVAVGGVWI